jgi:hypothetical protein
MYQSMYGAGGNESYGQPPAQHVPPAVYGGNYHSQYAAPPANYQSNLLQSAQQRYTRPESYQQAPAYPPAAAAYPDQDGTIRPLLKENERLIVKVAQLQVRYRLLCRLPRTRCTTLL